MTDDSQHYLIKIGIGSVQQFIGSARRSRDLWFGSHILSQVMKACARSLLRQTPNNTQLIFPGIHCEDDLQDQSPFQCSNILIAVIYVEHPDIIINTTIAAGYQRWQQQVRRAHKRLNVRLTATKFEINQDLWKIQSYQNPFDLFGVWQFWPESACAEAEEKPDMDALDQLFSARKRSRTFIANISDELGFDKSSLDARGEQVLKKRTPDAKLTDRQRIPLGIKKAEKLDCLGWTKRLGANPGRTFPPLIRVALDSWLRKLPLNIPKVNDLFEKLKIDCAKLAQKKIISRVNPAVRKTAAVNQYELFSFDAEVLLPSRWASIEKALVTQDKNLWASYIKHYEELKTAVSDQDGGLLFQQLPESCYLAIVFADGDKLGELQSQLTLPKLQRLSQKLSEVAHAARTSIAEAQGDLIYAGGDELLALLPLDKLWPALSTLHRNYMDQIRLLDDSLVNKTEYSIGVAIVHAFDQDAISRVHQALNLAKNPQGSKYEQGKSLGIVYKPRSGNFVQTRLRYSTTRQTRPNPFDMLVRYTQAFGKGSLPSGTPYLLRQTLQKIAWTFASPDADHLRKSEIERVLQRRGQGASQEMLDTLAALGNDFDSICKTIDPQQQNLTDWFNALLIARAVAGSGGYVK